MGRQRRSDSETMVVGAKLEPELHEALLAYTEAHGVSVSTALKTILYAALSERGGLGDLAEDDLHDRGYKDGVRQGLHEAKVAIKNAVDKLW